jgi:uncharacterized membrane protein YgcG
LAVADHKYRIEVGYGLEGILPDGKTGDIGRDMVPDLKASDYDGAVTLAVGEVAQVIADDAKITLNQDSLPPPASPRLSGGGPASSFFSSLCWSSSAEARFFACSSAPACSLADGAAAVGAAAPGWAADLAEVASAAVGAAEVLVDLAAAAADLAAAAPEEVGNFSF